VVPLARPAHGENAADHRSDLGVEQRRRHLGRSSEHGAFDQGVHAGLLESGIRAAAAPPAQDGGLVLGSGTLGLHRSDVAALSVAGGVSARRPVRARRDVAVAEGRRAPARRSRRRRDSRRPVAAIPLSRPPHLLPDPESTARDLGLGGVDQAHGVSAPSGTRWGAHDRARCAAGRGW